MQSFITFHKVSALYFWIFCSDSWMFTVYVNLGIYWPFSEPLAFILDLSPLNHTTIYRYDEYGSLSWFRLGLAWCTGWSGLKAPAQPSCRAAECRSI